jgi:predicted nuclease with RNAse H fold
VRIALIAEWADPRRGGCERSTLQIAQGLARRGQQVTVLCRGGAACGEGVAVRPIACGGWSRASSLRAFVAGVQSGVVAIDAPQSPNQGLMLRAEVRRRFDLRLGSRTWGQWKVCEYELRRRNIRLYNTPAKEKDAPAWMRQGFSLYRRLSSIGFTHFVAGESRTDRMMIEVHPHACFAALLGRRPFLKGTLEGRLQRQLVLYVEGFEVPNPVHVLEEITRHHLLTGDLPLSGLHDHDQLDALMAAYTAYLVGIKPARVSQVGDRDEGLITLPAPELKAFYH